jgi:hypothetical protein
LTRVRAVRGGTMHPEVKSSIISVLPIAETAGTTARGCRR